MIEMGNQTDAALNFSLVSRAPYGIMIFSIILLENKLDYI